MLFRMTTSPWPTTTNSAPGFRPRSRRTASGITTWPLEESLVVAMGIGAPDGLLVRRYHGRASYDADRLTNIGSNRYALKLTYNQSFTSDHDKWWLDFYGNTRWVSDNKEYKGANTLSQDAPPRATGRA